MIKKNEKYVVEIIDTGINGEGIAKIDNFTIFVNEAIKGEKVEILILKVQTSFAFAKVVEIIEKSPNRVEPFCPSFKKCGGCSLQFMNYEETLRLKENRVKTTLSKALKNYKFIFADDNSVNKEDLISDSNSVIVINNAIGMKNPFNYRNKAQYPVQDGKIGFYRERSHDVIENEECLIQDKESDRIAKKSFELLMEEGNTCYDEKTLNGNIRHIMVRCAKNLEEQMLIIITNEKEIKGIKKIVSELTKDFKNLKSIVQNINSKNTNIIMGKKCITLYGKDTIVDSLGDYKFEISPHSFYQVNPVQTEVLYNMAKKIADLSKEDVVFDLYCGIGTIGSFMAKSCKKVYGVEIVPEAIEDAKKNAKLNEITNIEFACGAAEDVIPKMYEDGIKADVVFVDPPRKGCDNSLLETLIKMKAKKIIYVSCNVATLARDLQYLTSNDYELKSVQPVDMFPWTAHVEIIAVVEKR